MTSLPDIAAPDTDLPVGHQLNGYRIAAVLARGRWSTIYRGATLASGARVVVKECRPPESSRRAAEGGPSVPPTTAEQAAAFAAGLARFRDEAALLARVRHPSITRLVSAFEANGTAYIVTAQVEGHTLARRLAEDPMPLGEAALRGILSAALDGLDCLHRAGYTHRDVKPANLLLAEGGGAILLDLGAARPLATAGAAEDSELTPGYAAPEQYLRDDEEGPGTDIYGLAATAYHAITGAPPPDALARIGGRAMMPAAAASAGYGPCLPRAIDRGLALDPADRPQSAAAFSALLDGAGPEPEEAGPAATAAGDDGDDYPLTIRVERISHPSRRGLGARFTETPPGARAGAAKMRRGPGWLPLFAAVLALAFLSLGAVGAWHWQRIATKTEWVTDAAGMGDTLTISEALVRARPGSTIRVMPGHYGESLVLDKVVHLVGDGDDPGAVVIAPSEGACLTATAPFGSIRGMSFRLPELGGGGAAIACVDLAGTGVILEGNRISGGTGPAVLVRGDARPILRANHITGREGAGMVLEGTSGGAIVDNVIAGGGKAAVIVREDARPLLSGNRITGAGQAGILLAGGGGRLLGNEIGGTGASGIEVRGAAAPEVIGNRIEGAGEAGIYVYGDGRGWFSQNTIVGNTYSGVVIGPGGAPVLTGNAIRGNGEHGILILPGAMGGVTRNAIQDNFAHGIALDLDATTVVGANTIVGNSEPQVQKGMMESP
jgi:parallel beta-helix repeat protein